MHIAAITRHTVPDDATTLVVKRLENLVPVAIYALAWVSASCTFGLRLADNEPDISATYKATDDTAVTLVDDKWSTIPEPLAGKLICADWQIIFASAESGGPMTIQIAWAPLGGF